MKALTVFFIWCVLFVLAWPVAILALLLAPIVWLLSIPFRIFGAVLEAILAFIKAVLLLPARLLGHKSS
jgi:hypothetical protein